MLFAELGEAELSQMLQENLPALVGGAVAIVVLVYLLLRGWRLHENELQEGAPLPKKLSSAVAKERADKWDPPEISYADRRGSIRRDGPPVRVVLASSIFRNGVIEGYVVDRSTGGLRILVQGSLPVGSTLNVRAVNAPETVGYVAVVVRSCRENGEYYELGCEFLKTPPWNVLLLFG